MASPKTLQIPPEDVNDIKRPVNSILRGLNVLPSKIDLQKANGSSAFPGPPDSVAIIEAGATAFSKWWATGLGAGGAAAVITAASTFWRGQSNGTHIALIIALGGVVIAIVLAIALIVSSDVKSRAAGAAAQYAARASVTDEYLKLLRANAHAGTTTTAVPPGLAATANGDRQPGASPTARNQSKKNQKTAQGSR
jgi:hypothetical protein